ncbi:MAG: IclR family transcriptional regulator C-terminal domain-containing protein [Sphingomonadales bacterium]
MKEVVKKAPVGEDGHQDEPVVKLRNVDRMGGFAKGLAVIEAFGSGRPTQTIAEVARLSGLDRASARRCLLTLVECGYARKDGTYFELTPRILRLAQSYLSMPLPRLVQPYLNQVADELYESCSAAVLDGTEIIYIARAVHHRMIAAALHAGSRMPAYCTSMGRVLLAQLPPEQSREILEQSERRALTKKTLTDVGDLMAELTKVRENGYSIVDGEIESNARSIAVPIFNASGQAVAAFTVGLHSASADLKRMRNEILPCLLKVQSQLATILS